MDPQGTTSPGRLARSASHLEEVQQGALWRFCGCNSEWGSLREVFLTWPGESLRLAGPPEDFLMIAQPDPSVMRRQTEAIVAFFEQHGIRVQLDRSKDVPPNYVFPRDLFFMTPAGAVLGRPAYRPRAGEEQHAARALASLGVPLLRSFLGRATFEGADALWLDPQTVLLGVGQRTNAEGRRQLESLLGELGVELWEIPMPEQTQHLLGIVNFVDRDLAVIRADKATPRLREALRRRGVGTIELAPDEELLNHRGMNFVTLGPRSLVMPAGCPHLRAVYLRAGIEVYELEVGEYLKAAGGLGCLTGILRRDSA